MALAARVTVLTVSAELTEQDAERIRAYVNGEIRRLLLAWLATQRWTVAASVAELPPTGMAPESIADQVLTDLMRAARRQRAAPPDPPPDPPLDWPAGAGGGPSDSDSHNHS